MEDLRKERLEHPGLRLGRTKSDAGGLGFGQTIKLKIAQKPYIVWSLGPKALNYESYGKC